MISVVICCLSSRSSQSDVVSSEVSKLISDMDKGTELLKTSLDFGR